MSTFTPERRASLDLSRLRPEDLAHLADDEFRLVVDADLRRKAPKSGIVLHPDLVEALRSPELAARWHTTLLRMQKSVDGTLGARESDYHAQRATLDGDIQRLADRIASGEPVRDPDSNTILSADEAKRRLSSLKLRRHSLRAKHMSTKASTVRFKTGLDDMTLEARFRRDLASANTFETVVAMERDYYAARARLMERAIAAHREAILADLDTDEDPDQIDTALWATLTPTETTPLLRGSHETNAGRGPRPR